MRRERNHDSHHQGHHQRDRDRNRRLDASPSKRNRKDAAGSSSKKKDNVKTTMTDFRIVGIEIKELGWTWGLIGAEAMDQVPEEKEETKGKPSAEAEQVVKTEGDSALSTPGVKSTEFAPAPASDSEAMPATAQENEDHSAEIEVKAEDHDDSAKTETGDAPTIPTSDTVSETVKEEATVTDDAEGKVGAKRKAQSPEAGQCFFTARAMRII